MNHSIRQDMTKEPVTISPDVSLQDAQEIMRAWGMRHLPVTDPDKKLIGLLSDRDILRAFALGRKPSTPLGQSMSNNPFAVTGDASIGNVAREMADSKYGCAVVVNREKEVIGIFTTTDALNILARILHDPDEIDFNVLSLEDYLRSHQIAGGGVP